MGPSLISMFLMVSMPVFLLNETGFIWRSIIDKSDTNMTSNGVFDFSKREIGVLTSIVDGTGKFADFLIAVEAEMNKVSWPAWSELVRSSIVVIFVIFFLAMVLFGYDMLWQFVFKTIGVLR